MNAMTSELLPPTSAGAGRRTPRARASASTAQRAEVLASLSSEAVLVLDAELRVLSASANTARLLGRGETDLAGRSFVSCVTEETRDDAARALASLLEGDGARAQWDVPLRLPSGYARTFECRGVNLLGDPTIAGVVLNLRDIHEQRVAEAALRAAHDQLQERLHELGAERAVDAALGRAADLLLHCQTEQDVRDVVLSSLPALLPGLSSSISLESADPLELVGVDVDGAAPRFVQVDACWALRTRRAHVSATGALLRCDHLDADGDVACLPLVMGGHAFGLVTVTPSAQGHALPPAAALDRLAVRLSIAFGNARLRAGLREG